MAIDRFPLVIDQRSELEINSGQLVIRNKKDITHIPIQLIQIMIMASPCHFSSSLLQKLAASGIVVVILPTRGSQEVAWVSPGLSTRWPIRQRQYLYRNHPHMAWLWVEKKIQAQQHVLKLLGEPVEKLEQIRPPETLMLEKILGIEGAATRYYFDRLAKHVPPQWAFTQRNRRPPRDPFNALLSLTYTLFTTEAIKVAHGFGFDPWVGFLHKPYPARPALALDAIEPVRPLIDLWCLALTQQLDTKAHFYQEDSKVLLNKAGRSIYFSNWARDRQDWYNGKSTIQCLYALLEQCEQRLEQLAAAG